MSAEQLAFYEEVKRKLSKGDFVEIDGNISYVFVYLYNLVSNWNVSGFEDLSEYLIYISELYKDEEKLSGCCLGWAYDCLLGLGRYNEFLDKTEPVDITRTSTHSANLRINIQRKIGLPANPTDILRMVGGRKTKFITNNMALYKDKVISCFDEYSENEGGWFSVFDSWEPSATRYDHWLFSGAFVNDKPTLGWKIRAYYSAYEKLHVIKSLSRAAEDAARTELGVPRIGEGWISETELYHKLKDEFSSTTVIQHGRPSWLARQHFDIWFPNWRVAVEYHGLQHFEPVEFFGGEETYYKTVERDKRKLNLARENDVTLLIVTEDDSQDELVQKIHNLVAQRKVVPPEA